MPSLTERLRLFRRPTVYNLYTLGGDASTQVLNLTAKELYQTQDNLRAVVDYLSNSIAQLPIKVYVRDGETERRRDRTSEAALTLWKPNKYMTEFEFVRALVMEYYIFGTVYVWAVPSLETESGHELFILPSEWIMSTEKADAYSAQSIRVRLYDGTTVDIPADEFVQFKTYSPGNPYGYLSPITALRMTLEEQVEAGRFRRSLWKSSGRLNAQIVRPANVQAWDDEARKKFVTAFREAWGPGGSRAGSIPVLEDGMEIKPFSTSFKEAEWANSVKLSRESVAAAYQVNPSLIWHTDTQTYASSKDNARALYAECLGPVIQMIQQRLNTFLLPKLNADARTYVEFDFGEKLKGSFEERASILQSSVGGPWLTRDEARAEMNLPPLPNGEGASIITPLNVTLGGQAGANSPVDDSYSYPGIDNQAKHAPKCSCKACKAPEIRIKGISTEKDDADVTDVLKRFFKRQAKSVLPKIGAEDPEWWNAERWNKELAEDLLPILTEIADAHGKDAADVLGWEYTEEITRAYLEKAAEMKAENINRQTKKRLDSDLKTEEPDPAHVFEVRENTAEVLGRAAATAIVSWAIREAAHQAQSGNAPSVRGRVVLKQWVTGENARESHAAMDGETVPIDADFSNGQFWPGDSDDPEESCGCNCSTEVIIQ